MFDMCDASRIVREMAACDHPFRRPAVGWEPLDEGCRIYWKGGGWSDYTTDELIVGCH